MNNGTLTHWTGGAAALDEALPDLDFLPACSGYYSYHSWRASNGAMCKPGETTSVMIRGWQPGKKLFRVDSTDGWRVEIHGWLTAEQLKQLIEDLKKEVAA